MRRWSVYWFFLVWFWLMVNSTGVAWASGELYEKAKVIKVESVEAEERVEGQYFEEQAVTVEVLTGKHKGKILTAGNTLSGSPGWDIIVDEGDKVILYISEENGQIQEVYISDLERASYLNYLIIGFVLSLVVIGGIKGVKSLVALGLTILAIYKILLPGLINGYSPIPLTIVISVGVTLITMIIVAGLTKKAIAASLGTLGGVLVAGILATITGDLAHLTGFASEESRMLLYVEDIKVDIRGLLFAGIIIGALGAIMDVAMSIASAVEEVKQANPALSIARMIKAGMNVGRDIMGTMANTLILAYTGGALPLLLLYLAYETSGMRILNTELIATEIIRAIAGSIGLIISVPITAIISGILSSNRWRRKNEKNVY